MSDAAVAGDAVAAWEVLGAVDRDSDRGAGGQNTRQAEGVNTRRREMVTGTSFPLRRGWVAFVTITFGQVDVAPDQVGGQDHRGRVLAGDGREQQPDHLGADPVAAAGGSWSAAGSSVRGQAGVVEAADRDVLGHPAAGPAQRGQRARRPSGRRRRTPRPGPGACASSSLIAGLAAGPAVVAGDDEPVVGSTSPPSTSR